MKGTEIMATINTGIQAKLESLWSLMDISDNLRRADEEITKIGNDLLTCTIHFVAYFMLTVVTGVLAWHFDLESTIIGISTLQNAIIPNLPSSAQEFSLFISVGFSIAPTLIELFTTFLARAQIKILQMFVVGLTAFDMVTDIPRAISFVNSLNDHFAQLGWAFGGATKWIFFLFWLFLCTIGFELAFVIFAFSTIVFFFKGLNLRRQGSYTSMKSIKSANVHNMQNKPKATVVEVQSE